MADFYQYYLKNNIALDYMAVFFFINTALKQIHHIPALYQYWSKKGYSIMPIIFLSEITTAVFHWCSDL